MFSVTLTLNSDGQNGITRVQRLTTAALTMPSFTIRNMRVTFQASAAEQRTITDAYIGHQAGAGDVYDFAATPVQLLFAGSTSKTIAASTSEVSDWASFNYDKTSTLLVAFYTGGGASADAPKYQTVVANANEYTKTANDAATVNKTGYSLFDEIVAVMSCRLLHQQPHA